MDIRAGVILDGPEGQPITIDKVLGRGGFGVVFAGRLPDDTVVAVKTVLTAPLDEAELHVFQNEVRHVVGIEHPHVVRVLHVYDGGGADGRPPYFVLEYMEGGSLDAVIERRRAAKEPFTVDELRALYLQVARGMAAVNAAVVHRDLKPANVLLDSRGQLRISDFGIAKLAGAPTRSATFKGWGTAPYQSPEAFEFGANTPAMDMYAAGVMFFELAAFEWPVQPKPGDTSVMAWRNAHLLAPPRDLRALRPDLPMDLVQLIAQMLQKNPDRRPTSWASVIERLEKGGIPRTGPDVGPLVAKATAEYLAESERQTRERQETERRKEREALLQQAFGEPVELLRTLVEAFNEASDLSKLQFEQSGPFEASVKGRPGRPSLRLEGQVTPDLDTRDNVGIVRLMAIAYLDPQPTARTEQQYHADRSCGSFNLLYSVRRADERFGYWTLLRFEMSPFGRRVAYPHWFAVSFDDLPRELAILNAMHIYQRERRPLEDEWFKELLAHLL